MKIRIEEFELPQKNVGYVAYKVWLGKVCAGDVFGHWNSHTFTYPTRPPGHTYFSTLHLPPPMEKGRVLDIYAGDKYTENKQEALDNLLAQVRQWIVDAGLEPATEAREDRDEESTH
jgi:hypothetical protein